MYQFIHCKMILSLLHIRKCTRSYSLSLQLIIIRLIFFSSFPFLLSFSQAKITDLEDVLAKLTADFEKATAEKIRCQEEADNTQRTIQLANRLVGGLASENVRWAESVQDLKKQVGCVCVSLFVYDISGKRITHYISM